MDHAHAAGPGSPGPPVPYVPSGPEHAFRVVDVGGDAYDCVGTMRTGPWILGADGTPSHAALGVLLDVVLGGTAVAHRPERHWGVTIDLYATFCAALPGDGGVLTARATTGHRDASAAVATGTVEGAGGQTLAVATQRVRFVPGDPLPPVPAPARDGPDDGDLLTMLGARGVIGVDGEAEVVLEAVPGLANPGGTMHGGIQFALAVEAVAAAVAPLRVASLHMTYVRPGPVDGAVHVRTATSYRGRPAAVVGAQVLRADGKPCAIGTATCTAV